MPDTEPQPVPAEEITPPAEEPQTPTPAPEPSPSEQPSVFEIKSAEPKPTPVESPLTLEMPASVEQLTLEPPPHPSEPPQSAPIPPPPSPTQTPQSQPSEPTQTPQPIQAPAPQPPSEPTRPHPRSFLQRAREKIQFRKRAKLEKIMALAAKKRFVTNDDAQKLLRVSDATATRYLFELTRQGRLRRSGGTSGIRYEPTS